MILIVDDKPDNIFSLKSLLNLHNFTVDSASSGEEALRKVLKNTYSLILLDVQMPDMDGFEVAEAISGFNKAKDTPIIFLSAINKDKKYITKGYTSGGTDYVTKPIDPDVLLLKVKTFYKLSEQTKDLNRIQLSLKKEIESRKEAQDKLAVNINELRSVMESLPLIAFTVKKNGQIDYVNDQWYEYSEVSDKFPEVHPEDESVCENWEKAFALGQEYTSEVRLKKIKTNSYRYYLLKVKPIKQEEEILKWVGTFMDIHQQKTANDLLEQKVKERTMDLTEKNEELETSNHELQQFAWVASHDLKEPLRKIQTFNYLIKDRFLKNNEEANALLDKVIRSSERMSDLIDNLLNYSRLSASSLFQPTKLDEILEEIISDLEISISEKGASITLGHLPVIDAIPSQIRQVFQNLISNGLKFSRKGVPPVISITADFSDEKDAGAPALSEGKFCRIHVKDNGIGFEEEFIEKIFVIFQRLHTRDTYEGTGIGLAITKKIIEKHNGIIQVKSKVKQGSVFTLILPVKNNSINN
ncbi:hybrid sensor histidine kinase/response regulator [Sphingobacteriaceae bacterium]|nr:hybrid sensor histidine kinase/response regulator [Sphingobacteriaceae bacterium]